MYRYTSVWCSDGSVGRSDDEKRVSGDGGESDREIGDLGDRCRKKPKTPRRFVTAGQYVTGIDFCFLSLRTQKAIQSPFGRADFLFSLFSLIHAYARCVERSMLLSDGTVNTRSISRYSSIVCVFYR